MDQVEHLDDAIRAQVEVRAKYAGYIERQEDEIESFEITSAPKPRLAENASH